MKTATYHSVPHSSPLPPYPNAATRRQLLHRIVDLLLVAAIGAGSAASLLFALVLF